MTQLSEKDSKNLKVIAFLAITYGLLFNSVLIFNRFELSQANLSIAIVNVVADFGYACIFSSVFFATFIFSRLVLNTVIVIMFLVSTIAAYFAYQYNTIIDPEMINIALMSNKEFYTFINIRLVLCCIVVLITTLLIIRLVNIRLTPSQLNYKLSCIGFIITASILVSNVKYITHKYMPFNILTSVYEMVVRTINHRQTHDISGDSVYSLNHVHSGDFYMVIILGESARYDHFTINGYPRPTSPNLLTLADFISYNSVSSCGNFTLYAVPCLLTGIVYDHVVPKIRYTSLMTIFNKLGFSTLWITNQSNSGIFNDNVLHISKEAQKTISIPDLYGGLERHDEYILPHLDYFLTKQNNNNNLIILHSKGSHFNYDDRYPEQFKLFKPNCSNQFWDSNSSLCNQEEIVNSYDNSILYTDYFISEVINRFKNKNALIIYISDHGESLGEDGRYMHGGPLIREQTHVPLFIWPSPAFIKNYPQKVTALKAKKDEQLNYKNIFSSILDCAGINSTAINRNLSLCFQE